ncbi:glucan endo-1,3-beta-glucosidase 13-like isoform X2 [Asparagus officinalis]|uniref:glucan endo-1,3-beta-glucosidase 13-like isoform X2 n=1 Tax=Asparagus officinalis TaxID=4686 RepID=UPI00098E4E8B|nr:glucan endo-1,3-beta-glucosidase 13-like isoform X2 [Asparagus officinalis]
MKRGGRIFHGIGFLILEYFIAAAAARVHQKAESIIPIPTNSPPEGNTTFIDGSTWCVALPGASQVDLQNALDWVCGLGAADCSSLQPGGPCHQPDTLLSHASYAFNSYYQENGNSDVACNFGGTATITKRNPSYASCMYLSSQRSSAYSLQHRSQMLKILAIFLLLYLATL